MSPCTTLCLCVEEIAKVCASSALMLIIQAVGSFPLIHAGNERQKRKYFPMLSERQKLIGYLKDYPVERMFRGAKLTQIFEGSNQIQRMIIGREIMKSAFGKKTG